LQYQYGRPVISSLILRSEKEISRYLVCFIKPVNKKVSKILRSILAFLLLAGTLFLPMQVQAGFFSSLFDNQTASADTANTVSPPPSGDSQNLQNLSILSATVSPSSISQSNDTKTDNQVDPNANVNIVSDNAILPATGPAGVSDGTNSSDSSANDTSVYVVRDGDNLAAIAKMFNISVDTILWANDMKKGDKLTTGDVLLILPVSGVEYTVKSKDSLKSIASHYKVDVNDIIQNNDITLDTPLNIGDTLIIPNGEESQESDKPVKDIKATAAKDKSYYKQHPTIKNLAGYYADPVPGYRLSQGIHDNNAVDLAVPKGTPVHAAASGIVTFAKLGYNGGFGGLVIISHPNGTETLYAHLSKLSTHIGENVSQNDVIAYSGGVPGTPYSGHSTGAHLHFEVHGARNPGADPTGNSWKY
jgi:LysM repeat protein